MTAVRCIKRIESISKAPVYNHLNDTLAGIVSIRAYGLSKYMFDKFDKLNNVHTLFYGLWHYTMIQLGLNLDILSQFYMLMCIFSTIGINYFFPGTISSAVAGFMLTMGLGLAGALQWGVKNSTIVESAMVSVERIVDLTKTENEDSAELSTVTEAEDSNKINPDLALEFKNVTLFYENTTKPAIKKLNFSAKPGEKIGIVGRTGAGKSSILYSLFRLKNIEPDGKILIFGQDSGKMALEKLRKQISYIPQDPFLFEGSVRENLDPLKEYSEKEVKVAFETAFDDDDNSLNLNTQIYERGKNIAAGQRQLLCLARALLKNNKILVVDEATANVDQKTDAMLQKTLQNDRFENVTILTIAHRIETIKDSDKIMVMDKGRISDIGSYEELMVRSEIFRKMVEA